MPKPEALHGDTRDIVDPRFTADDIANRPFAVEQGYNNWAEDAGRIMSERTIDIKTRKLAVDEAIRAGFSTENIFLLTEVLAPKVVQQACEAGYRSRAETEAVEIGTNTTFTLLRDVLGKDDFALYKDLRTVDVIGIYGHSAPATSKVAPILPRIAKQSYLWGRTGSLHFLSPDVGATTSTVTHHDGLMTTDLDLENREIARLMREWVPPEALSYKIGYFALRRAAHKLHVDAPRAKRILGYLQVPLETVLERQNEEEDRLRAQLRANLVAI